MSNWPTLAELRGYYDQVAEGAAFIWEHRDDVNPRAIPAAVHAALPCLDAEPSLDTPEGVDKRLDEILTAMAAAVLVTTDTRDDEFYARVKADLEAHPKFRALFCRFFARQVRRTDEELSELGETSRRLRGRLLGRLNRADRASQELDDLLEREGLTDGQPDYAGRVGIDPLTILAIIQAAVLVARVIVWVVKWWRNRDQEVQA